MRARVLLKINALTVLCFVFPAKSFLNIAPRSEFPVFNVIFLAGGSKPGRPTNILDIPSNRYGCESYSRDEGKQGMAGKEVS